MTICRSKCVELFLHPRRMLQGLVPRSPNFLRQRTTTVIVSWFACGTWKNNTKRYNLPPKLLYEFYSIYTQFTNVAAGLTIQIRGPRFGHPCQCVSNVNSPCVIKRGEHVWERGSIATLTLGRGLDGYKAASRTGRFTPGGSTPGIRFIAGWVDPRTGLVLVNKKNIS